MSAVCPRHVRVRDFLKKSCPCPHPCPRSKKNRCPCPRPCPRSENFPCPCPRPCPQCENFSCPRPCPRFQKMPLLVLLQYYCMSKSDGLKGVNLNYEGSKLEVFPESGPFFRNPLYNLSDPELPSRNFRGGMFKKSTLDGYNQLHVVGKDKWKDRFVGKIEIK